MGEHCIQKVATEFKEIGTLKDPKKESTRKNYSRNINFGFGGRDISVSTSGRGFIPSNSILLQSVEKTVWENS